MVRVDLLLSRTLTHSFDGSTPKPIRTLSRARSIYKLFSLFICLMGWCCLAFFVSTESYRNHEHALHTVTNSRHNYFMMYSTNADAFRILFLLFEAESAEVPTKFNWSSIGWNERAPRRSQNLFSLLFVFTKIYGFYSRRIYFYWKYGPRSEFELSWDLERMLLRERIQPTSAILTRRSQQGSRVTTDTNGVRDTNETMHTIAATTNCSPFLVVFSDCSTSDWMMRTRRIRFDTANRNGMSSKQISGRIA